MSLRRRRRIWLPNQFFGEDRSMLSRRIFVTTALGAGAVLATQDHKAAAQTDRRMIVFSIAHGLLPAIGNGSAGAFIGILTSASRAPAAVSGCSGPSAFSRITSARS